MHATNAPAGAEAVNSGSAPWLSAYQRTPTLTPIRWSGAAPPARSTRSASSESLNAPGAPGSVSRQASPYLRSACGRRSASGRWRSCRARPRRPRLRSPMCRRVTPWPRTPVRTCWTFGATSCRRGRTTSCRCRRGDPRSACGSVPLSFPQNRVRPRPTFRPTECSCEGVAIPPNSLLTPPKSTTCAARRSETVEVRLLVP